MTQYGLMILIKLSSAAHAREIIYHVTDLKMTGVFVNGSENNCYLQCGAPQNRHFYHALVTLGLLFFRLVRRS